MARIFWHEEQVPSIGIRPWIVYGPGRDNGLTASPTLAMAAAARRRGLPDRVRRPDAAPVRTRHGARLHRRGSRRDARVRASSTSAALPCRWRRSPRRSRSRRRASRSRSTRSTILPFPEEFDGSAARRGARRHRLDAARTRAFVRPSSGCEPCGRERGVDGEQRGRQADEHPEHRRRSRCSRRGSRRARAATSPTGSSRPRASTRCRRRPRPGRVRCRAAAPSSARRAGRSSHRA